MVQNWKFWFDWSVYSWFSQELCIILPVLKTWKLFETIRTLLQSVHSCFSFWCVLSLNTYWKPTCLRCRFPLSAPELLQCKKEGSSVKCLLSFFRISLWEKSILSYSKIKQSIWSTWVEVDREKQQSWKPRHDFSKSVKLCRATIVAPSLAKVRTSLTQDLFWITNLNVNHFNMGVQAGI